MFCVSRPSSFVLKLAALAVLLTALAHDACARTAAELNVEINRLSGAGAYEEALKLTEEFEALAIREYGAKSVQRARAISWKGFLYRVLGRPKESEGLFEEALEIYKETLPPDSAELATGLNNLGIQYHFSGRNKDAAKLFEQSFAIREKVLPPTNLDVAGVIINLAKSYQALGRLTEAEALLGRALVLVDAALKGAQHPYRAAARQNYAVILEANGRYKDAEPLLREAVAIRKASQPPTHPEIPGALAKLAENLYLQGRFKEAEELFYEAMVIRIRSQGYRHPDTIGTLIQMGRNFIAQRKGRDAREVLEKARENAVEVYASQSSILASIDSELAEAHSLLGDHAAAHALSAQASASFAERGDSSAIARRAYQRAVRFAWDFRASATGTDDKSLQSDSFSVAQWSQFTTTANSVTKMAARMSLKEPALREQVREREGLERTLSEQEESLTRLISIQSSESQARRQEIKSEIDRTNQRLHEIDDTLSRDSPEYFSLVNARPLELGAVQERLGPNDALVSLLSTPDAVFVWAVTKEGSSWHRWKVDSGDLENRVQALRSTLDSKDMTELFDLAKSYDLYRNLLAPAEATLSGKRRLLVVPTGALTGLPFHLLVTAPAKPMPEGDDQLQAYRTADWLVRRHSIEVLPSVTSLEQLARTHQLGSQRAPLIGFANPKLGDRKASSSASVATASGSADYWRERGIDFDAVRNSLEELPETEFELATVGEKMNADKNKLLFRDGATERAVKSADLANYKVAYFATHGLIAGELKGLDEPSLVLSLPQAPSDEDDGFLTASEISQLNLDADLVVLSACNTAAGEKPGAESLSGLARAFLYAGARSLLVSHWRVNSEATTRLTTSMFDLLSADPKLDYPEALQQAMIAMIEDRGNPLNAYPGLWSPFIVVGASTRP